MIPEVVLNDEDKNELNKIKKNCRQKIQFIEQVNIYIVLELQKQ